VGPINRVKEMLDVWRGGEPLVAGDSENGAATEPRPVLIKWSDAFDGPQGWVAHSTYEHPPVQPLTLGWVVGDPVVEEHLVLYSSYYVTDDGETMVSNPMHIPIGMLLEIKNIGTSS
jgi:hypothetical protein